MSRDDTSLKQKMKTFRNECILFEKQAIHCFIRFSWRFAHHCAQSLEVNLLFLLLEKEVVFVRRNVVSIQGISVDRRQSISCRDYWSSDMRGNNGSSGDMSRCNDGWSVGSRVRVLPGMVGIWPVWCSIVSIRPDRGWDCICRWNYWSSYGSLNYGSSSHSLDNWSCSHNMSSIWLSLVSRGSLDLNGSNSLSLVRES